MFDEESAELLRSAPGLTGLDSDEIPAMLANAYAGLVAQRLSGERATADADHDWPLSRLADVYELIAAVTDDSRVRRSAAFVAASAQRLDSSPTPHEVQLVTRERVDPSVSAPLLFLLAEQYADAADAATQIELVAPAEGVTDVLVGCIVDLCRGRPGRVLDHVRAPREFDAGSSLESLATEVLLDRLLDGIAELARLLIGLTPRGPSPAEIFEQVAEASARERELLHSGMLTAYPGPRHLAELLRAVADTALPTATVTTPTPPGIDESAWGDWLRQRARSSPFIWPNHRAALLDHRFHERGKSAVIVYPTGAGKTTLTSFKVQATLAAGEKVVFLAPTHALAEQLTRDFHAVFREKSAVTTETILDTGASDLANLEVMTPERCLARMSYSAEAFQEVGLLVFDECHLLSPESGPRRALDAMLCVLAFNAIQPEADLLFLSAMLTNGEELAGWLGELTGRPSLYLDSLWKPTRQARGVVTYLAGDIEKATSQAIDIQRELDKDAGRPAKGLRAAAERELRAVPYCLFGLQHNWLSESGKLSLTLGKLSEDRVQLAGGLNRYGAYVTPNSNEVAKQLSTSAIAAGLKTIVFVNSRRDSLSVARSMAHHTAITASTTAEEEIWKELDLELGALGHSVLRRGSRVVPHNALMLRLERDLAEKMFRRTDGADVIVATPTLAQGLNLPASLAIIAGDKRTDRISGQRALVKAHELQNAAGRAGRAGHLANGVVLLIPEPVVTMPGPRRVNDEVIEKLRSVMPSNDRCLDVQDPLEKVLDAVSSGIPISGDVEYSLNRMLSTGHELPRYGLNRSLAAFRAKLSGGIADFSTKLTAFQRELTRRDEETPSDLVRSLAARSGVSPQVIARLIVRFTATELPASIPEWADWTVQWLMADTQSLEELIATDSREAMKAAGLRTQDPMDGEVLQSLQPAIQGWVLGDSLAAIQSKLTGAITPPDEPCTRARELVLGFIPRAFSYAVGIASATAVEVLNIEPNYTRTSAELAATAIRDGLPSPVHVALARSEPRAGRRRIHKIAEQLEGFEVYSSDDFPILVARLAMVREEQPDRA